MANNVEPHENTATNRKCDHRNHLERQHRTWRQKLVGIKEVYRCAQCGEKVTIK